MEGDLNCPALGHHYGNTPDDHYSLIVISSALLDNNNAHQHFWKVFSADKRCGALHLILVKL